MADVDFGVATRNQLELLLEYELWLIDNIGISQIPYEGGNEVSTIQIKNEETPATIVSEFKDSMGNSFEDYALTTLSPLTFVTVFKIIDMVMVWVLNINKEAGTIDSVPKNFEPKADMMLKTDDIIFPKLNSEIDYWKYFKALYNQLRPYRNSIVHGNHFTATSIPLKIIHDILGTELTLPPSELGFLVKIVITIINWVIDDSDITEYTEQIVQHHLDQLHRIHIQKQFKVDLPKFINVELTITDKLEPYEINLDYVKRQITKVFGSPREFINLTISIIEGNTLIKEWYFPSNEVPRTSKFELKSGSYPQLLKKL